MVLNEKIETLTLVELLKSVRTIRNDWSTKTAYQKWCYIYSAGKMANTVLGLPLYQDDQKLHWYSYGGLTIIGVYFSLGMYTACYYIISGEFVKLLPSTCLLSGPALSVSIKIKIKN